MPRETFRALLSHTVFGYWVPLLAAHDRRHRAVDVDITGTGSAGGCQPGVASNGLLRAIAVARITGAQQHPLTAAELELELVHGQFNSVVWSGRRRAVVDVPLRIPALESNLAAGICSCARLTWRIS